MFILLLLLLFVKMHISGLSGRLTWGLDKLFVDSQERRLGLLTALVQSNHLRGGGEDAVKVNTDRYAYV